MVVVIVCYNCTLCMYGASCGRVVLDIYCGSISSISSISGIIVIVAVVKVLVVIIIVVVVIYI